MSRRDDAAAAPRPPEPVRLFYDRVVETAELREAMAIEGLDEEVAILRIRLREQLDAHPEDHELMLKSVASIVKAVSMRYRIGDKRTRDLASMLAAVVDAVTDQFV